MGINAKSHGVFMPVWDVFLVLQTLCDGDDDCKANPFVFIIHSCTGPHLPAKCLPYTVYFVKDSKFSSEFWLNWREILHLRASVAF